MSAKTAARIRPLRNDDTAVNQSVISGMFRNIAAVSNSTIARRIAAAVVGVVLVVILWSFLAAETIPALVPAPLEVVKSIVDNFFDIPVLKYIYYSSGGLFENVLYTMQNVLTSVTMGTSAGMIFGIALARSRFLKRILEPPLLIIGTFPVVMLLPFFTMWFGTDRLAQYGLVLFYTFITVTLVARQATVNVAGYYEDFARSLGANRRFFRYRVIVPAIVPEVVGAVRISLAAGWGFETVAEILGAPLGVGRLIQVFSVAVMTTDIFGVLLFVGVIAVITDGMVSLAGKWIVRWKD
jgi:ABC-type nitrate/sulfonate/bicarbonate transport system permease component